MIAKQENLALPAQPEKSVQTTRQWLQQSQGVAFDQADIAYMVQDHEKDIAASRKEAQSGQDPGVRSCGWTKSSGCFARVPGVLILELRWAEIA
jgi:predicted outer membrane protein